MTLLLRWLPRLARGAWFTLAVCAVVSAAVGLATGWYDLTSLTAGIVLSWGVTELVATYQQWKFARSYRAFAQRQQAARQAGRDAKPR